jgi:hypothetical protein
MDMVTARLSALLRDRPILFKAVSSAVVALIGDAVAQTLVPKYQRWAAEQAAAGGPALGSRSPAGADLSPVRVSGGGPALVPALPAGESAPAISPGSSARAGDGAADVGSGDGGERGTATAEYDSGRTARMCVWRAFVFAPLAHAFYIVVDRAVPYTGARGVVIKVAIDQLLYAAPMTMCVRPSPPARSLMCLLRTATLRSPACYVSLRLRVPHMRVVSAGSLASVSVGTWLSPGRSS